MRRLLVLVVIAAGLHAPSAAHAEARAFHCGGAGGATPAMEASYMVSPCWMHVGHHTYDLGAAFAVGRVDGSLFSVEIQFSPPTELVVPASAAVVLESSLDGRSWNTVSRIEYPLWAGFRQGIAFSADGSGTVARYLRVRQPRSAAQGLSGYLDHSEFTAELEPSEAPPMPAKRELTCSEDTLERFFDTHPCWAGGVNRYDSPSVFHTYPLGSEVDLGRVTGSATFLPWRTDDYSRGSSRTAIAGVVQSSVDGSSWVDLGRIDGVYGMPITFDIETATVPSRYVRIVAERHAQYTSHPALKHVRGMLLDSAVTVEPR